MAATEQSRVGFVGHDTQFLAEPSAGIQGLDILSPIRAGVQDETSCRRDVGSDRGHAASAAGRSASQGRDERFERHGSLQVVAVVFVRNRYRHAVRQP